MGHRERYDKEHAKESKETIDEISRMLGDLQMRVTAMFIQPGAELPKELQNSLVDPNVAEPTVEELELNVQQWTDFEDDPLFHNACVDELLEDAENQATIQCPQAAAPMPAA